MAQPGFAQVSSASTVTQVVQQGNRFTISGGALSAQGVNLFYQLGQLNLTAGQVADFQADAQVQAVFGQILGGERSVIDGLLQISGANADLYLINPAGIFLGPNATLNLPANFTATTATGIGFEQGGLDLFGANDYGVLNSQPLSLSFAAGLASPVINQGNLAVNPGQSLSLLGDTVVNTGTLSAPGGRITVVAIQGSNQVRLSQAGQLLSLEGEDQAQLTPMTLPVWLTGDGLSHADGLEIGPQGEVILVGANQTIVPTAGLALVSGQLDVSSRAGDTAAGAVGGFIQVLGEQVALVQATLDASGGTGGGTVHLGGDYQGTGTTPTATVTLIDRQSTILADALNAGEGGEVIVWADYATQFLGHVTAQGAGLGAGGFVEISGKDWLGFSGTVELRSQFGPLGTLLLDPQHILIKAGAGVGSDDASLPLIDGSDTTTPFIIFEETLETLAAVGNLELLANDNITVEDLAFEVGDLSTNGELTLNNIPGDIIFRADANGDGIGAFTMLDTNDVIRASGRNLSIFGASITTGDLYTNVLVPMNAGPGGAITLSTTLSAGNGPISTGLLNATSRTMDVVNGNNASSGGMITIAATIGNITTGNIRTVSRAAKNNAEDGGTVLLSTQNGDINTGSIRSFSLADNNNAGRGGDISLSTANGGIVTGLIESYAQAVNNQNSDDGGAVALGATADIVGSYINTQSDARQGGNITVVTGQQYRATGQFTSDPGIVASLSTVGNTGSGTVDLQLGSLPFQIGDASTQGTAAAIVAGTNLADQLLPTQTIAQDTTQGNIQILNAQATAQGNFQNLNGGTLLPNQGFSQIQERSLTAATQSDLENVAITAPSIVGNGDSTTAVQLTALENRFGQQFQKRLNLSADHSIPVGLSLQQMSRTLQQVEDRSGTKAGLVYAYFVDDQLEIILVTAQGQPVLRQVSEITQAEFQQLTREFQQSVTNRVLTPRQYLPPAQALYDLMILPIVSDLEAQEVESLAFVLDEGFRSIPLAALHDGERFLVESYSLGLLPTFSLTDFSQVATGQVNSDSVVAMGIELFEHQTDLFAVPVELDLITQGKGTAYLNHDFTRHNLEQQLHQQSGRGIVHLATHAVFRPGGQENSYIQLWDQKLTHDQLRQLPLSSVSLLVLSACTTALGDPDAEYGFAGFAVSAGAETALASLWAVSDEGSMGFMAEFYRQLDDAPVRSEALRQAQLQMLRGELWMAEGGLYNASGDQIAYLPQLANSGRWDFTHPAYWSAFTMIGNPW